MGTVLERDAYFSVQRSGFQNKDLTAALSHPVSNHEVLLFAILLAATGPLKFEKLDSGACSERQRRPRLQLGKCVDCVSVYIMKLG